MSSFTSRWPIFSLTLLVFCFFNVDTMQTAWLQFYSIPSSQHNVSCFVVFIQDHFGYSGLFLGFYTKFLISFLLILWRKLLMCWWILCWHCWLLWSHRHFSNTDSSNLWTWNVFLVFVSSAFFYSYSSHGSVSSSSLLKPSQSMFCRFCKWPQICSVSSLNYNLLLCFSILCSVYFR